MSDRLAGKVVGGYEIEREIGRGGMGVVYLARHRHLGRDVALKLLVPEIARRPQLRRRFIRESRVLAALEHPNIVTIYDAGEDGDLLYIAMRLVRGTNLQAALEEEPLPPEQALTVLEGVASALDAAHAAGLIHRDVKPANVFVEQVDRKISNVWLGDFGLTKRTSGSGSAMTKAGSIVGTVAYMAPEQFEGRNLDGRADQYSLACLLYECMTGRPPFAREHDAAVMYAHLNEPPPPLEGGLPALLDAVLARAMAKQPGERFESCSAFASAARDALVGAPGGAKRPRTPRPQKKKSERTPRTRLAMPASIAVGLVALAIAVFGLVRVLAPGGPRGPDLGPLAAGAAEDKRVLFMSVADERPFWIRAQEGARAEDLSGVLDLLSPGADDSLDAGRDGTILVTTRRFGCEDWACLAVLEPDLSSASVVTIDGEPLRPPQTASIGPEGDVIVFVSGDGPHEWDLFATRRTADEWTTPVLLTAESSWSYHDKASIAPDGASVVFECGDVVYATEATGICQVGLDGQGFRRLIGPTDGPRGSPADTLQHPAVTADGGLVFAASWDGQWRVWLWRDGSLSPLSEEVSVYPCAFGDGRVAFVLEGTSPARVRVMRPGTDESFDLEVPEVGYHLRCAG